MNEVQTVFEMIIKFVHGDVTQRIVIENNISIYNNKLLFELFGLTYQHRMVNVEIDSILFNALLQEFKRDRLEEYDWLFYFDFLRAITELKSSAPEYKDRYQAINEAIGKQITICFIKEITQLIQRAESEGTKIFDACIYKYYRAHCFNASIDVDKPPISREITNHYRELILSSQHSIIEFMKSDINSILMWQAYKLYCLHKIDNLPTLPEPTEP